jgi:hypothetical protein
MSVKYNFNRIKMKIFISYLYEFRSLGLTDDDDDRVALFSHSLSRLVLLFNRFTHTTKGNAAAAAAAVVNSRVCADRKGRIFYLCNFFLLALLFTRVETYENYSRARVCARVIFSRTLS